MSSNNSQNTIFNIPDTTRASFGPQVYTFPMVKPNSVLKPWFNVNLQNYYEYTGPRYTNAK